MNIKSQKGFTGTDITIAVIILAIFMGTIAALFSSYTNTSKQIARESTATNYAVNAIEEIKRNASKYFNAKTTAEKESLGIDKTVEISNSGYYKTITVKDYKEINDSNDIVEDIVKLVTVKIEYQTERKNPIEISTVLTKNM